MVSRAIVSKYFRTRFMFMNPTDFCMRSQFLDIFIGKEALAVSMGLIVGGNRDGSEVDGMTGISKSCISESSVAIGIAVASWASLSSSMMTGVFSSTAREEGVYVYSMGYGMLIGLCAICLLYPGRIYAR